MWLRLCVPSLLAVLVVGCDRLPGAPKASVPVVVGSQEWMTATFNSNCRGCHSQGAEGAAISLVGAARYWKLASDAHVIGALSQGQGVSMPAYLDSRGGPLSAKEISLFVQAMRAAWGAASESAPANGAAVPSQPVSKVGSQSVTADLVRGDPTAGARVFEESCSSCHGEKGSAGSVTDPMYLKLISDQGLWSAVVFGRSELGSPAWDSPLPGRPNGLTPTEVADAVSWIASKRTP